MKVLEVFGEPIVYGGQESFVIDFLQHMNRNNVEVNILTPYYCKNTVVENKIFLWGGKIIEFGLKFEPGKSRANLVNPLKKYLLSEQYDVVHVHSGSISVLALVAFVSKKCRVRKVIVHSHCAVEHVTLKTHVMKALGYILMKNSVDVYCACSRVAGESKYINKVVNNKLHIINNGVDLEKYKIDEINRMKIRRELKISDSTYVIGHIGRFSYQKNHEFLIDIFKSYHEKNSDSVLILLGDGESKEQIKEKINDLNLDKNVYFMGNVDNVSEFLQAFDVFVLPSRYEGLPIVGVEAQASGLPCIVSNQVSDELKMTDNFSFLPINEGVDIWIDAITKYKNYVKVDCQEKIRNKGYDIKMTANKMRKIYFE